eukprot:COSAG01_NODE_94_length_26962_cov_9.110933_2_plen_634_part_00
MSCSSFLHSIAVALDEGKADGERTMALLCLFGLSLRNAGVMMVDVLVKYIGAFSKLLAAVYDGRVQGRVGATMCVNTSLCNWLTWEILLKCGAAVRGPLEKATLGGLMTLTKASCPKPRYQELLPLWLEATQSDDAVVASAACEAIANPTLTKTAKECMSTFLSCEPARVCWGLWQRLIEPGAPVTRWRPLAQELSAESVSLALVANSFNWTGSHTSSAKGGIPHDGAWPEVVAEAAHMSQVCYDVKLSAPDRYRPYFQFGNFVVSYAALDSAHHPALLPCAEALLWIAVHGSAPFGGVDSADYAAAACVSLLGRNEAGLTLDKDTVDAVLRMVHIYFDTSPTANWSVKRALRTPAKKAAIKVRLVTDMVIADANKPFVLQHPHALDDLVTALLLDEDNPRHGQDGADKLQETAALALENLALSEAGKEVLRAHTGVMASMRALKKHAMSDAARKSASVALFELDEEARRKAKEASAAAKAANVETSGSDGDSTEVEHVMLSYNWAHQDVIKRLNAALQARGYVVWIDIEKMQGSTVEAMAEAVEECAVMCYGVSNAYKESTNCRMEAQYAHQQEKDMVPLMLEDGYRAKGWLGMLLGVRLWYGFFGATLASDETFEDKVEELCRELGERGKE